MVFTTIIWHLPWNSCTYIVSEQYNERISSCSPPGVCQNPPGSGEQSQSLQGDRPVQVTYSSGAQSFVSPESGVVCVNSRPMRGPGKRSQCLQGVYRKCRSFPARVMLWSLLPRSQAWAIVAGIHSLWLDLHREASFQESRDQVSADGEEAGDGKKETYVTHFRSALAW